MKGICYIYQDNWIRDPLSFEQPIKVGKTTTTLQKRIQGLRTATPGTITILMAAEFDDVDKVEKAIHQIGKDNNCHIKREWFKEDLLKYVKPLYEATGKKITVSTYTFQPAKPAVKCWVEKDGIITCYDSFNKAAKATGIDFRHFSRFYVKGKIKKDYKGIIIYFKDPSILNQYKFGTV